MTKVNMHNPYIKRDKGYKSTIVKSDGDRLGIHRNQRTAQSDVVGGGRKFIAECGRRYNTTGIWTAIWSNGRSKSRLTVNGRGVEETDIENQALIFLNINSNCGFIEVKINEIGAMIHYLSKDVPISQDMPRQIEWLQENVVGSWGCFSQAVESDEDSHQVKSHFLFKKDTDAVAFKLRFG
jgi:hypothetical protein